MTPELLIKKLLAQREFSVEVEPGKRITLRRPAEMEIVKLLVRDADGQVTGLRVEVDAVKRCAVGWEGVTEADIVTSGASDPIDFDAALFGVMIEDRRAWAGQCADALLQRVVDHLKAQQDASGN